MKASATANTEDLLLHAGWLRRFAVALVNDLDAAEDIVQETLVAAWQRPGENTGRAWLARVARNLAIDRWRSSDRRERRELAAAATDIGTVASPEELIGDAQIHRAVAEVVAGLDEPFRQTIVLRFFHGASSADIARRLRIPDGTVRWRLKEGIDRVRRQLDARYGEVRKDWVAALLPLLPRPAPTGTTREGLRPHPRPVRTRIFDLRLVTIATAAALMAGVIAMVSAIVSRHRGSPLPAGHAVADDVATQAVSGAQRALRFNLPTLAPSPHEPEAQPGAGPGEADASSLLAELLQAIQANAYDDFVAKGSAFFKAAVPPAMLRRLSATLGARLATGYQTTLLGSLRRPEGTLWLFRLEFADGGDDALVSMPTDGWQVASFVIDDPQTREKEK
ncbi:MAG TPA: RNA polymerase sigma factor [Polyangia bacterium]|nr:RNA polymerase sigma factor [Polyangia bacterium]